MIEYKYIFSSDCKRINNYLIKLMEILGQFNRSK
jgi:hypothetical protein